MKVNNSQLISLLFSEEPELAKAINRSIPYISIINGKHCRTILSLRCLEVSSLTSLLKFRQKLVNKLTSLLGYEIHLECTQNAIGEDGMVAVAERQITENNTEQRFYPLEPLAEATRKSIPEVKILLAEMDAVIHPRIDGSEEIEEFVFDAVLSRWAKSLKGKSSNASATATVTKPKEPKTSNSVIKVLSQKLMPDDIAKTKGGKSAGSANLTMKGIQITLENFFNKVRLDDTTIVDAVSAFIEGTSEFGIALRKELLAAYKRSFKGINISDVETKLIAGAKGYLDKMSLTEEAEVQS